MPAGKPNTLDIWGDDIGITNLSCYSNGLMVHRTLNIDRIAAEGMRFTDSHGEQSIAELLKPLGDAMGQFGKNHLGDLNKHLPTAHGFDEFFGNLYHLNAEEEPENADYPAPEEAPREKLKKSAESVGHRA
jgi:arylsulfatase A-like enzyme